MSVFVLYKEWIFVSIYATFVLFVFVQLCEDLVTTLDAGHHFLEYVFSTLIHWFT